MMESVRKLGFIISASVLVTLLAASTYETNGNSVAGEEYKTWARKTIDILRSAYLGGDGLPSREVFLRTYGLYPLSQEFELTPYFRVSYARDALEGINSRLIPRASAEPLNLDFYVEHTKKYCAPNSASPIWDGRVYEEDGKLIVGGYSDALCEKPVGTIDDNGKFIPESSMPTEQFLLLRIPPAQILFDPYEWKLLRIISSEGGAIVEQERHFLPLTLYDQDGILMSNLHFALRKISGKASLVLECVRADSKIELAECEVVDSTIVNRAEGYKPILTSGCSQPANDRDVITFTVKGEFSSQVQHRNGILQLMGSESKGRGYSAEAQKQQNIVIDGSFDDWRNIQGVGDPEGDCVAYLYPNPDTDILQFKVANDSKSLYFYSRVRGAHGRTGSSGRYYWYVYIDVDTDPNTGYSPTRDDNCYFGVAIGDDCEAQFEFVANRFVKGFFGFTGVGAEEEVLNGRVQLGASFYSSKDAQGRKRERYKVEYVNREGSRFITHDYTEGSSEGMVMALSSDGSEVEMAVDFGSFLWDKSGKPLVSLGRKIDLAVGVEAKSDLYGTDKWGADSSPVIYGYRIKPAEK